MTPAVVAADPHRFHDVLLRGDPTLNIEAAVASGCDEGDVKFSVSSSISSWNFFVDVWRSAFTAIRSSVLRITVLILCDLLFCEFRVRGPGLRSLPPLHHVDARPERMRPNRAVVESFAVRVLTFPITVSTYCFTRDPIPFEIDWASFATPMYLNNSDSPTQHPSSLGSQKCPGQTEN